LSGLLPAEESGGRRPLAFLKRGDRNTVGTSDIGTGGLVVDVDSGLGIDRVHGCSAEDCGSFFFFSPPLSVGSDFGRLFAPPPPPFCVRTSMFDRKNMPLVFGSSGRSAGRSFFTWSAPRPKPTR